MLSTLAFVFAGSVLLTWPIDVSACRYDSPIISEGLRRQYQGLPPRATPRAPRSYRYEGHTFTAPSTGATIHRYTYKDGRGKTYRGTIETFPGGTVRHQGRRQ